MFNESNIDNRSRVRIRGRVIGFTDSKIIEFVKLSLKESIPLWSHLDDYPDGHGVSFCVELDGFLTFDQNAQVKIIDLSSYQNGFYDPTRFAVVAPADPPLLFIDTVSPVEIIDAQPYNYVKSCDVHTLRGNGTSGPTFRVDCGPQHLAVFPFGLPEGTPTLYEFFKYQTPWKGVHGYPSCDVYVLN